MHNRISHLWSIDIIASPRAFPIWTSWNDTFCLHGGNTWSMPAHFKHNYEDHRHVFTVRPNNYVYDLRFIVFCHCHPPQPRLVPSDIVDESVDC